MLTHIKYNKNITKKIHFSLYFLTSFTIHYDDRYCVVFIFKINQVAYYTLQQRVLYIL